LPPVVEADLICAPLLPPPVGGGDQGTPPRGGGTALYEGPVEEGVLDPPRGTGGAIDLMHQF